MIDRADNHQARNGRNPQQSLLLHQCPQIETPFVACLLHSTKILYISLWHTRIDVATPGGGEQWCFHEDKKNEMLEVLSCHPGSEKYCTLRSQNMPAK